MRRTGETRLFEDSLALLGADGQSILQDVCFSMTVAVITNDRATVE